MTASAAFINHSPGSQPTAVGSRVHYGNEEAMRPGKVYRLQEGVQVRPEVFGLLFYDYRGPKLYFVPSQDLIDPDFFAGQQTEQELIESISTSRRWSKLVVRERLEQILDMLESKGLVHGQSLC